MRQISAVAILMFVAQLNTACTGFNGLHGLTRLNSGSSQFSSQSAKVFPSPVMPLSVQEVWIAPNIFGTGGASDQLALFDSPDQYSDTLGKTNVFQFGWGQVGQYSPAQLKNAVSLMQSHNIKFAYESWGLALNSCDSVAGADLQTRINTAARVASQGLIGQLKPIYEAGGYFTYVSLDGSGQGWVSLPSTDACQFDTNSAPQALALFMKLVHKVHPEIQFGLLPNFPNYNYNGTACYFAPNCSAWQGIDYRDVLNNIVKVVRASGEDFTYMNVDNPANYFVNHPGNVDVMNQRILPLKAQTEGLGLRFGVIMNSELPANVPLGPVANQGFFNQTTQGVINMATAGALSESNFIVESWYSYPTQILSESSDATFMSTALASINLFLTRRHDSGATAPGQQARTAAQLNDQAAAQAATANQAAVAAVSTTVLAASVNTPAALIAPLTPPVAVPTLDPAPAPLPPVIVLPIVPAPVRLQTETVYRYSGDLGHLFTLNSDGHGISAAFTIEGAAFDIFSSGDDSTSSLYRCRTNGHQFLSTDSACEGQTVGGLLGYIGASPADNLRALYRMHSDQGDYLEGADQAEGLANGYTVDGILGYVP